MPDSRSLWITISLRRAIVLLIAGVVFVFSAALLVEMGLAAWTRMPEEAGNILGGGMHALDRKLVETFQPVERALTIARDMLRDEVMTLEGRDQFDRFFISATGAAGAGQVTLYDEAGAFWRLESSADTHRTTGWPRDGATGAMERLYDRRGELLGEERTEEVAPTGAAIVEPVLEGYRQRLDNNRGPKPKLHLGEPYLAGPELVVVDAGVAVKARTGRTTTAVFQIDLSALHRWTSRSHDVGAVYSLAMTESGNVFAPPTRYQTFLAPGTRAHLPRAAQVEGHPGVAAALDWLTQEQRPEEPFRLSHRREGWWAWVRPFSFGGEQSFLFGVVIREEHLLQPLWEQAMSVGSLALAALTLAALLAWWLSDRVCVPLRTVVTESKRAEVLSEAQGYWPKTRFRELRALMNAFDEFRQHAREEHAARERELAAAVAAGPAQPPDAFLQTLTTTRRELREAQEQREAAQAEAAEARLRVEAFRNKIERLAAVLEQLSADHHVATDVAAPGVLVWLVHEQQLAAGSAVWQRAGLDGSWNCVAASGVVSQQAGARQEFHDKEFLRYLVSEGCLTTRDAFDDVRTQPLAQSLANDAARALALIAVPRNAAEPMALLCLYREEAEDWPPETPLVMHALAAELEKKHAPVAQHSRRAESDEAHEDFFHQALDCAPVMLWVLDEFGRIRYANPCTEQVLLLSTQEQAGEKLAGLCRDGEAVQHALSEVMETARTKHLRVEMIREEGGVEVELYVTLYESESGQVEGWMAAAVVVKTME